MKNQPAKPLGFKSRFLLVPLALVLAMGAAVFFTRPPAARPPAPVPLTELSRTNLTRLNNLWCLSGQTNPFTGVMLETYPDGLPMSRSVISNGLLSGLSEGWYTNGQMQIREYYRSNLSDGVRTKWYPNGHKLSEATIAQGEIVGVFRHWHQDGTLAEEIPMRAGKQQGVGRAWYPSGYLQAQVEVRDGQTVSQKTWKDGERKEP